MEKMSRVGRWIDSAPDRIGHKPGMDIYPAPFGWIVCSLDQTIQYIKIVWRYLVCLTARLRVRVRSIETVGSVVGVTSDPDVGEDRIEIVTPAVCDYFIDLFGSIEIPDAGPDTAKLGVQLCADRNWSIVSDNRSWWRLPKTAYRKTR